MKRFGVERCCCGCPDDYPDTWYDDFSSGVLDPSYTYAAGGEVAIVGGDLVLDHTVGGLNPTISFRLSPKSTAKSALEVELSVKGDMPNGSLERTTLTHANQELVTSTPENRFFMNAAYNTTQAWGTRTQVVPSLNQNVETGLSVSNTEEIWIIRSWIDFSASRERAEFYRDGVLVYSYNDTTLPTPATHTNRCATRIVIGTQRHTQTFGYISATFGTVDDIFV